MNRVLSVDKSLLSGGTVQWYVTMQDGSGNTNRVEITESAARQFQTVLQSQQTEGNQRLLTETYP